MQSYTDLNMNGNQVHDAPNLVTSENPNQKIKRLTAAEYNALQEAGTIDENTYYMVEDLTDDVAELNKVFFIKSYTAFNAAEALTQAWNDMKNTEYREFIIKYGLTSDDISTTRMMTGVFAKIQNNTIVANFFLTTGEEGESVTLEDTQSPEVSKAISTDDGATWTREAKQPLKEIVEDITSTATIMSNDVKMDYSSAGRGFYVHKIGKLIRVSFSGKVLMSLGTNFNAFSLPPAASNGSGAIIDWDGKYLGSFSLGKSFNSTTKATATFKFISSPAVDTIIQAELSYIAQ